MLPNPRIEKPEDSPTVAADCSSAVEEASNSNHGVAACDLTIRKRMDRNSRALQRYDAIGVDVMCEPRGIKDTIKDIPFKVAALADVLPKGSSERSLANSVYAAIRADVEYAVKRLEAGLKD